MEATSPTELSRLVGKRFFIIWVPVILPLVLAANWFYHHETNELYQMVRISQAAFLESAERLVHDQINPIIDDLNYVSSLSLQAYEEELGDGSTDRWLDRLGRSLLTFSQSHPAYDQIRILDVTGKERLRANNDGESASLEAAAALQDKGSRYYFRDAMKLRKGEIYISPLDLNIENKEIEYPLKPMIRFAETIYRENGEKLAVVILNYKADLMLNRLRDWDHGQEGNLLLVNRNGFYLLSTESDREWGFMFPERQDHTFKIDNPDLWNHHIGAGTSGQLTANNDLWSFATVYLLQDTHRSGSGSSTAAGPSRLFTNSTDYYWKLILHVPGSSVNAAPNRLKFQLLTLVFGVCFLLGLFSFFLSLALARRDQAQARLKTANERLEHTVEKRTNELVLRNERLLQEVEQRAKAEKSLAESEQRHTLLLEAMHEGLFMVDRNGTITFCNTRFAELVEYRPSELFGKKLHLVLDEDNRRVLRQLLQNDEKGRPLSYEITWKKRSGTPLPTTVSPATLRDEAGTNQGFVGLVSDISTQKEMLLEKQELEQQLYQSRKMEAIGSLASGIAHDFNNILASIVGNAELAELYTTEDSTLNEYCKEILAASSRGKELIRQILAFSRQTRTQPIVFNPATLIEESIKLLRPSIPPNIELVTEVDEGVGTIKADPTQFNQVLLNLCTNASHAMEKQGGKLVIRLEKKRAKERVCPDTAGDEAETYAQISVTDTGIGIPSDLLEKIFEPYFTTKEMGKGTGLGLAVVHGIVQGNGGSIHVESVPGKGSSFYVCFPVVGESSRDKRAQSEEKRETLRGSGEMILFVDDEHAIVKPARTLLEQFGYSVESTTDSRHALKLFEASPARYDLVITDQAMPGLSGHELASRLLAVRPDIPIILCTGHGTAITETEAAEHGIRAYLIKPVSRDILMATIREVLDPSRNHQPIKPSRQSAPAAANGSDL